MEKLSDLKSLEAGSEVLTRVIAWCLLNSRKLGQPMMSIPRLILGSVNDGRK